MKISEYNEKNFIKSVLSNYATTADISDFDDCVIIDLSNFTNDKNSPYLVYSIDHPSFIKREEMTAEENYEFYGRWAAACTCGDILAMGANVKGFSMDLSMPLSEDTENIKHLYNGTKQTLNAYSAVFEGGNIDINNLETVCFAWGIVEKGAIVKRVGANIGDYIFVTGELGVGWSNELAKKHNMPYDKNYKKYPFAPIEAMQKVFKKRIITSGMDLTDGIIEFLYTILERNHLGVVIDLENVTPGKLQYDVSKKLGIDPRLMIFNPGYDTPITHGWTIPQQEVENVINIFKSLNLPYMCLGRVTEHKYISVKNKINEIILPFFCDDQFHKNELFENWLKMIKGIQKELNKHE